MALVWWVRGPQAGSFADCDDTALQGHIDAGDCQLAAQHSLHELHEAERGTAFKYAHRMMTADKEGSPMPDLRPEPPAAEDRSRGRPRKRD